MGPKVRAACQFVERTGGFAAIGSIDDTPALLRGEAGTTVTLDAAGVELGRRAEIDTEGDRAMATTEQPHRGDRRATDGRRLVRALARGGRRAARRRPEQRALERRGRVAARVGTGPNKFAEAKAEPRWRAFVRQYRDPMQIVLLVAGIGSLYPLKELGTGLVMLFLTLFNAVLGLRQEGKAAEAVAALQKMMIVKARVRRDGELVAAPGRAARARATSSRSRPATSSRPTGACSSAATLEIAESALTGESLPVSKGVDAVESADTPLGDRTDMVYMNTNVTRGAGELRRHRRPGWRPRSATSRDMLQAPRTQDTPLTRPAEEADEPDPGHRRAPRSAISIVLNLSRGESFDTVFTAAIAFAIAAIPTGLPAVVTTILSLRHAACSRRRTRS